MLGALIIALSVSAHPPADSSALAQKYLQAAISLYDDLEYEAALDQLNRAKSFATSPDQDVRIALYEGLVLAGLSRVDASQTAFKRALSLDPDVTLPKGVPPKVAAEFERLRAELKKELSRAAPAAPPPAVAPVQVAKTEAPASSSALSWVPGIAGAACLAASSYFFIQAKSDWDGLHGSQPLTDPSKVASDGATMQTVGWVLAGIGAAGVATTAVLWATDKPDQPVTARLGVGPGGLLVRGEW